mgnify:CR=1 FL=1
MAVFFWITIWQFASMYLGQEILLASPVSVVRKLFELSFTGNFWQSVGFSFVRIVTGFLLAMFLGIFLAVLAYWSKTVEILIAPVIAVVKSTPVASFIILCLIWIPSRNLSVFISLLRHPFRETHLAKPLSALRYIVQSSFQIYESGRRLVSVQVFQMIEPFSLPVYLQLLQ